jgi:hypothetical protein
MALYRQKPITVEAMQWSGHNAIAMLEFTGFEGRIERDTLVIPIGELRLSATALPGDWIMKAPTGDLELCSDAIFTASYDPE